MIFGWILVIVLIIVAIIMFYLSFKDNSDLTHIPLGALFLIASIITVFFVVAESRKTPTALDVYRGNTTLEITYRDSIPVDSIVVFKEKVK